MLLELVVVVMAGVVLGVRGATTILMVSAMRPELIPSTLFISSHQFGLGGAGSVGAVWVHLNQHGAIGRKSLTIILAKLCVRMTRTHKLL